MNVAALSAKLLKTLVFAFALAAMVAGGGRAEERKAADAATAPTFEQIKKMLDDAETAIDDDNVTADKLVELRDAIAGLAATLRAALEETEPRSREAAERLKQIGPAPPKDAPAESPEIAAERKQQTEEAAELDDEVKQGRLLLLRADQLSERISEKRHTLYARELFARTQSIFDPHLWIDASNALPVEWRRFDGLIAAWQDSVGDGLADSRMIALAIGIAVILLLSGFAARWVRRFVDAAPADPEVGRAWLALRVFLWRAARFTVPALAIFLLVGTSGLLTDRLAQIAQAIVAGIAVVSFGSGVAASLFAPSQPLRRLARVDDQLATVLHNFIVWSSIALAVTIALQAFHKAAFAPLVITVATNVLFAAVSAGLLSGLIARLGQLKRQHAVGVYAAQWFHPLALIMAILISAALVAGYASFSAFLALRAIVAAVVFGGLYLLLEVTKAIFARSAEQEARRQALADHLGVTEHGFGLFATLLSGIIRLLLIALSCVVIVGPWEISTADLFDTVRNVPFGFKIEEIHLSFRAVLGAFVALGGVVVLTRVARGWLENELLPCTTMEPSLQQSIATIFGYVGVIAAIALALGTLGIDLQKIALVAGALSVGIGFGLQSIVSNFVSGLILLAERPIRAGDAIVVKGEEGWVRRVRVRATEIETYDRASVIIPNSELITGVVKNWTRANTLGRIVIKVGASYAADPERVRDLLIGLAKAHPQIVQTPPPGAFLVGFGESALQFELRSIVLNVENALSVKSDLHFAIIKAFKAAGIEMSSDTMPASVLAHQLFGAAAASGR